MNLLLFCFCHCRAGDLPWLIELAKRSTFNEWTIGPTQIVYETTFELLDPL
jgi:hypothetical protein